MSQLYNKIELYEDALENAEKALSIKPNHEKSLFRKATALAYLFDFEQS